MADPLRHERSIKLERSVSYNVGSPYASSLAVALIAFVIAAVRGMPAATTTQTLIGAAIAAVSAGCTHSVMRTVRRRTRLHRW